MPDDDFDLPPTLRSPRLAPFISPRLATTLKRPIRYRAPLAHGGWKIRLGFEATIIPEVCNVFLMAREAGALHYRQVPLARNAERLVRGLAVVGINALVDDATGYAADRTRRDLHRILEAYVARELLPWTKRFPDEFYKEMFRLRRWEYDPSKLARPQYIGKLTNVLVYRKLPPGVFDELRARNPVAGGRRKHKHHQLLTSEVGHPHLDRQISVVTAMMRGSANWDQFKEMFRRAFPEKNETLLLPMELSRPSRDMAPTGDE